MLRSTFLYLSRQSWLRNWMETSPASRRLTSRFIAGQTLDDGIRVARQLSQERIFTSLDFLGENVTSLKEAGYSLDSYLQALDAIEQSNLPATVSVKPTHFGLQFSESECRSDLTALVQRAKEVGTRIEIDMESSEYTDRTLGIVRHLHATVGPHVRAVIQAYLYRSEKDIGNLSSLGIPVRLCKGAYREPARVAFQRKRDVDRNYLKLMKILLEAGTYPGIASHDESMVRQCLQFVKEKGIASDHFEFQMLYGIRRDLQQSLTAAGFRLRAYVPYGDAWYPYFMRRLAERPANVLFLARNFLPR
jgi:proline dehydrogenase